MPTFTGFDREFWEMMPDTVSWERRTGQDAWGRATFAAPEKIEHVNISYKLEEVMSPTGAETMKAATVVIGTPITLSGKRIDIGIDDRITLPNGVQPRILMVGVANDEVGPHHIVVQIGVPGGA